jgi:hypothetical protein
MTLLEERYRLQTLVLEFPQQPGFDGAIPVSNSRLGGRRWLRSRPKSADQESLEGKE